MNKKIDFNIPEDDTMRMEYFMEMVRKKNDEYFKKTGKRKKHLTVTFGCQMNPVRCIFISH